MESINVVVNAAACSHEDPNIADNIFGHAQSYDSGKTNPFPSQHVIVVEDEEEIYNERTDEEEKTLQQMS